jgi:hypothetical protein
VVLEVLGRLAPKKQRLRRENTGNSMENRSYVQDTSRQPSAYQDKSLYTAGGGGSSPGNRRHRDQPENPA